MTPNVVVEIDFAEFTTDGHIRYGTYLGLREDKDPTDVTLEMLEIDGLVVAGVQIINPDRQVFGDAGYTKPDVAGYDERAGERLTEIAGYRPLSLLRCPRGINGERFFQKHGHGALPSAQT